MSEDPIDDFNPFAPNIETTPRSTSSPNKPAILKVNEPKDIQEEQQNNSKVEFKRDYSDLEKRSMELDRKAIELEERERAMKAEQMKSRAQPIYQTDKNWPPLPSFLPCKPCFHVDFENDFNDTTRPMIKYIHYLWIAYVAILFVNLFGTLTYFIVSKDNFLSGSLFGTSILIFIILPIFGFLGWNRTIYRALKKDSSLSFFGFFIMFAIHIVLIIIQALGIEYLGSCGWINSLKFLPVNRGAGIFMLLIAIGFTLHAAASIVIMIRIHSYYRGTGANLQRAKQEATVEIGQNIFNRP